MTCQSSVHCLPWRMQLQTQAAVALGVAGGAEGGRLHGRAGQGNLWGFRGEMLLWGTTCLSPGTHQGACPGEGV